MNALRSVIPAAARVVIRVARRLRAGSQPENKEDLRHRYFSTATQYYASGRAAYFAQAIPTAGNILHHAVEMYLKGYLVQTHDEGQRRRLGHNLRKIWRRCKQKTNDAALGEFDPIIRDLDAFEELRYPEKILGWAVHFELTRAPGGITGTAAQKVPRFQLALNEVDGLVAAMFQHANLNPQAFAMTIGAEGRNALTRHNPSGIW